MTLRVYGRTEYAEPLVALGAIEDDADPRAAFEGAWLELVVFPEDAVHWIVRDGGTVDDD
jgi:hypothetical protein